MINYLRIDEVVNTISVTHKFNKPVLKFLNTSDVYAGNIININELPITELKGQAKKTIKKNDILFSEIRPKNRRYAYVDFADTEDYVVSTKLMVLRKFNENVDNYYFYYFLTSDYMLSTLQERAENRICSFPQITFDLLKDYKIRVPHLEEQVRIASILYNIDKKVEINNQISAELEAMAKMLYDYWFVQFDFPDADGKPYKSSGGRMVYNEVLKREIPEGWEQATLWDIAKYYNGLAMQKYRPTGNDYLPVIKIREMNNGISSDTEKASIDIPEAAIVNDGDLLFSWSATLDVKIWSQGKGALNQHIFKVTSDDYPQSFYYFELMNYLSHFKMMADMRKTTMGHITLEHLKQANIVLPPIDLIKKLDEKLKSIFEHSLVLKKENNSLVELRDWLLPMLMNGQVTVK